MAERVSRGALEAQVMNAMWDADVAMTPREVQAAITTPRRALAYNTVMTILVRLWRKGMLERESRGRAYAYRPVTGRDEWAAARMQAILEASGDRALTLNRFVDGMSGREAAELRRMLETRKRPR